MNKAPKYLLILSVFFLLGSISVPYCLDVYFHYYPIVGESDWHPVETNAYLLVKPLLNILFVVTLLLSIIFNHLKKKQQNNLQEL